jgi:hypothetical protein
MTLNEVAGLLGYSREQVETLIAKGMQLPKSKETIKLAASEITGTLNITDDAFNDFVARFDAEEPGRHPPAAVRRELLVESNHACAICKTPAPPQFHHMLEWAKIKHHDPAHMLHLCGACHDRCGNGQIDHRSQIMYKTKLRERHTGPVDPHLATKRAADKKILAEMLDCAPRPLIVEYLEQASREYLYLRLQGYIAAVFDHVTSPTFHLYDKELWKLINNFLTEWNTARTVGRLIGFDTRGNGIASPANPPDGEEREAWFERREEFTRRIFLAQQALTMLNSYIREEYPELDLEEIDRNGLKSIEKMEAESRRRLDRSLRATQQAQDLAIPPACIPPSPQLKQTPEPPKETSRL